MVWYGRSGNENKVFENIQLPWFYRAQIDDEGTGPLVVKLLYNGQVVAQDAAIGKGGIARVRWEGPHQQCFLTALSGSLHLDFILG